MLVLARKKGEWIQIGDDIYVTVVKIFGRKVKIGILAPAEVAILRTELEDNGVAREGGTGGFLVLTRSKGEAIRIGDSVTLTVVAFNGSRVRLGIEAPQDVAIHRADRVA